MSRPPHGRERVLQAARELALNEGVRGLTLSRLERRSGISRGGILYHWPNREALVQGLIKHDQQAWDRYCAKAADSDCEVSGHIRCALAPLEGIGTLAARLLPEARELPAVWAAVEAYEARRFQHWSWDDADLNRYVLLLAAEGAFWRRLHGLDPDVPGLEQRLRDSIEGGLVRADQPDLPRPRRADLHPMEYCNA